ncbi:hypothetical protein P2H44_23715 [Albimonas sp. CAU 1670]|uniref:hypothetical protein n=1 Tax=Albimonas sp. CAU 1670 TaxID=3032599 RepID=UPI0023DBB3B8|nr:hypothetical protein [Albimonas sp. CAU 1670]MDF2235575.1 hypothetical protein [Albimonas sp. CAU 1670]
MTAAPSAAEPPPPPPGLPGALSVEPTLADVQGLWRRLWLRTPAAEDATTEVHWLQAGPLHVDLRLPADPPDVRGARSLSDLPPRVLRLLARAEGFAGATAVERGVCTWTRRVNWRGPLDGPDVGALFFENGDLMERGVFADYAELWRRLPGAGPLAARQLRRADGQAAVLARAGERFLLGRGAPEALAAPASLPVRLERALAHRHRGALRRLFDQEFCHGRLTPGGGIIERSTNPLREGALAFPPDAFTAEVVHLTAQDFDGVTEESAWFPV